MAGSWLALLNLTHGPAGSIKLWPMPTYEYECAKCGLHFEKVQSMSAKPLEICPEDVCEQKRWARGKVKRAISAGAGLIFKGSGFYITDYRSEKYKEAAKKDSSASQPAASTSSSGSSETKKDSAKAKPTPKPVKGSSD
jgi:putative FmdB family regulatory protein